MELDSIDIAIDEILQKDARVSFAERGRSIGISKQPVPADRRAPGTFARMSH